MSPKKLRDFIFSYQLLCLVICLYEKTLFVVKNKSKNQLDASYDMVIA